MTVAWPCAPVTSKKETDGDGISHVTSSSVVVLYDHQGWVTSSILGDFILCIFLGDIMNGHVRFPWRLRQSVARGAPRRSLLIVTENPAVQSHD